jgi:hypothetical protein
MDIIDACKAILNEKLQSLESVREEDNSETGTQVQCENETGSQAFAEGYFSDPDKNLNKILSQQVHLKRIIDQDNTIQILKSTLVRIGIEIEGLRKQCTKQNEDALTSRQELSETQAKEVSSN